MNRILYYIITLILLSWFFKIPYLSKYTAKFKPKTLKPSLVLLFGFIGGSIASDINENQEVPATYNTIWLSRLIKALSFGTINRLWYL